MLIFLFACIFGGVIEQARVIAVYLGIDNTRVSDSTIHYIAQKMKLFIRNLLIFLCSISMRNVAVLSGFRICES